MLSFVTRLTLVAFFASGLFTAPASGLELEAGPLQDNNDAMQKCPGVCGSLGWDGGWRDSVPGSMSVCRCYNPKPVAAPAAPPPMGHPTSCSVPSNGACKACSVSCPPGKQARCEQGHLYLPADCFPQSNCECK